MALRLRLNPMLGSSLLVAAALAAAYVAWQPPSADLFAQTFRSDLFASHGFVIWDNSWYDGLYVPSYSLLFPPLGALLGPAVVGALAAVASAGLFALLARDRYGDRAWLGSTWFGFASASMLFTGRLTFALGIAVGLAALVAAQRRRLWLAGALAALTSFASPVAGLFVAIVGRALSVTGDRRRGLVLGLSPLPPILALGVAFPIPGAEPFPAGPFWKSMAFAAVALALLPRVERELRWGVTLFALASIVLFVVPTPVGDNVVRMATLFGGPVAVLALTGHRPWFVVAAVAVPLFCWQWYEPVRELVRSHDNPAVDRAYFHPLVAQLAHREAQSQRIEIPPTIDRGEAAYVAPRFPLVRGWLRQAESDYDERLFSHGRLTAGAYGRWLHGHGVSFVAVARAPLDSSARAEVRAIRRTPAYLRRVWSDRDWTLYRVSGSPGLVSPIHRRAEPAPGARVTRLHPESFALEVRRPGTYLARIHFSRYWTVSAGRACIAPHGRWTRIVAKRPGPVRMKNTFSLGAALDRDGSCSA